VARDGSAIGADQGVLGALQAGTTIREASHYCVWLAPITTASAIGYQQPYPLPHRLQTERADMKYRGLALFMMLICLVVPRQAFALTGEAIKPMCAEVESTAASSPGATFCAGFMIGLVGGWNAAVSSAQSTPPLCYRKVVTPAQLGLVFSKYLRDHPEQLHESVFVLGIRALDAAFPCPAK
jgi:hypothetical protein